jgi:uncharacterized protein with von Willebrand factor type A (vWA) domain
MEKLTQVKNYLLELAFIALLVRVLSVGCGIGEALALISVVSSMTYNKFLTKAKTDQYDELILKINSDNEKLEAKFTSEKNELNSKIDAMFEKLTETQTELVTKLSYVTTDKSLRRTNESQTQNVIGVQSGPAKRYF